jgi:nucleoid-associated protein YgaU
MSNALQVVRFALGLIMVAAGGFLAAPFVAAVVDSARQQAANPPKHATPSPETPAARSAGVFAVPGTDVFAPAMPTAAPTPQPPRRKPAPLAEAGPAMPPQPLPPVQPAGPPPGMNHVYRTTVEMPPPPLLDTAAAPPARLSQETRRFPGVSNRPDERTVPDVYRVRDGDDLTAIATRLYGHPRGATALWQANADRLESPDLLPIGMPLMVPPAWQVFQGNQAFAGGPQQIEPQQQQRVVPAGGAVALQGPAATAVNHEAATAIAPWLGRASASPGGATVQPVVAGGRGSLRVVTGETLESIARRVYGDPQMATRLFAANRDRLRSPELLVPGMELRLP